MQQLLVNGLLTVPQSRVRSGLHAQSRLFCLRERKTSSFLFEPHNTQVLPRS